MDLGKSISPSGQQLQVAALPDSPPPPPAAPLDHSSRVQPSAPPQPSSGLGGPYRVLITDAGYKHAIALARYIRRDLPNVHLTGHREKNGALLPRLYGCYDELVSGDPLEALLERGFDQVIPVGAGSTLKIARLRPNLAVLPSSEVLENVYSKFPTLELAQRLGVPVPRTQAITSMSQLDLQDLTYPCVLKADRELAPGKKVVYCHNPSELLQHAQPMVAELSQLGCALLVQEYIQGPGHGFFALLDHGVPLRLFMHQRLREAPPSGGISTAAAAFYSPRLDELGRRLLAALHWHGVAMAEFKYDVRRKDFFLMEVNGKFWGSLELALRAGVNFGADLIRLFRNEPLQPDFHYNRDLRFYWPLDGDMQTLWRTHHLHTGVLDYFRPGAVTNLGQSKRADWLKFFHTLLQIMKGE